MAQINENLKKLRTENGFRVRDLARKLDLSPATISLMENGNTEITFSRLEELARLYKISVEEIICYHEPFGVGSKRELKLLHKSIHENTVRIEELERMAKIRESSLWRNWLNRLFL